MTGLRGARGSILAGAVVLLVVTGGCASPLAMRGGGVRVDLRRAVVMQPDAVIGQLAVDSFTLEAAWTKAARAALDAAVRDRARRAGLRLLQAGTIERNEYARFARWAYGALEQIALRVAGKAHKDIRSVTQWHYDRTLLPWRTALDADHVLIILFGEAQETTGQAALSAFGLSDRIGRQVGVACWVSLRTGFVDWCEYRKRAPDDLRVAKSARSAVDGLLEPLLTLGADDPS